MSAALLFGLEAALIIAAWLAFCAALMAGGRAVMQWLTSLVTWLVTR